MEQVGMGTGQKSDQELVVECQNGNNGAYDILVSRYELIMYRTALAIVNDPDVAKDVTQNGFIKTWEKLHTFRSGSRFYSWLYRVIINEALNQVRNVRRMESLKQDSQDDQTPYHHMVNAEDNRELYSAIARLNEDQKVVLLLRHFEDHSYREIADILQIDEKTVKSRLFSARMKLRDLLR
ncbi:MAG: RNA polymerase sigma factor [Balneolaceae bacterium]|nr:MAG: RNA polymerase sigma factor [Balneolaceae bacterium]